MNKKLKLLISFISVFLVLSVVACSVFVIVDLKKNSDGSSSPVPETGKNESSYSESIEESSEESSEGASSNEESSSSPPPHTHQYSLNKTVKPDCKNKGYSLYKCSCGESYKTNEIAALGHSFSDWKTTKEPTVEAEGLKERTCSRCGEKETKSIEKLPEPEIPINPDNSYEYIMGKNVCNAQQMVNYVTRKIASTISDVKLNCTLYELATYYLEEGAAEGIRGDIAFCQAILETGWFRFPPSENATVEWWQNNYCGLGANGNGAIGTIFENPRIGVRAHIQHLKSYATNISENDLVYDCVDPKFNDTARGQAQKWTDLNGKWAVPGTTYGQRIIEKYQEMISLS